MKKSRAATFFAGATGVLVLALFLSAAAAPPRMQTAAAPASTAETILAVDPAQSTVHWTVDSSLHTVHGTFNIKSGRVHFDPATGKAGGEVVVFATSGDSGSDKRDTRMHKEILESAKYPEVVFRPSQVEGKVSPSGACDVKLHGTFSIHGAEHELVAPVHAELAKDHWKGTATFEVPYVEWGIKDPSNFLLKVKKVVNVEIDMSGAVQVATASQ
jgi:polyisoprenoid-binding protein YceI